MTILIASDFLMTSQQEQESNLKWTFDLLARPLRMATAREVRAFSTTTEVTSGFSRREFFRRSLIEFDELLTQFSFEADDISEKSIEYLRSNLTHAALVVGYELSEATRTCLERAGITYVDIWLHPIRFLDDVLFGLYSNSESVRSRSAQHEIQEETFFLYADRLRVQNYRGFRRTSARLISGSALFVGQTLVDKAIERRGKMLTLLNFKERFSSVVREYEHVYYSRHPFVREGDEPILAWIREFRNVSLTGVPTYELLASPEIDHVLSISSSVVHEARYFEKSTEFLYRPVFEFRKSTPADRYVTLMHEPFLGWFWSDVLKDLFQTIDLPKIGFSNPKDKTRDALSFYWGYRNIDKVESLKQTVGQMYKAARPSPPAVRDIPPVDHLMAESSLVSFDIFDTLVTRKTFSPRDVFDVVGERYEQRTSTRLSNFRAHRIRAEEDAVACALSEGREDCTLEEIYTALRLRLKLDELSRRELMAIEMEVELDFLIPRPRGVELFNRALGMKKRVILTSDMYLPKTFIIEVLEKCGIQGYEEIYLSSEIGVKKSSGRLFRKLAHLRRVSPASIVHVGDNPIGDTKAAQQEGLKTYRLPRSLELASSNPSWQKHIEYLKFNRSPLSDAIAITTLNRWFDNELQEVQDLFDGDAFHLGYCALGPTVVSFVVWIEAEARRRGIKKLYFLSRDMKIACEVFRILHPQSPIESVYLLSSRRSVRVPSIRSRSDLLEPIHRPIYSNRIIAWLSNNYGLTNDADTREVLAEFGLRPDSMIGNKFERSILEKIVLRLESAIMNRATYERANLKEHLAREGLTPDTTGAAVVDLGYACSVQAALQNVLGIEVQGLYYATFHTALRRLRDPSTAAGYAVNFGSPKSSGHGISSHRFVFESLFCEEGPSFLCFERGEESQLIPQFSEATGDNARVRSVAQIHGGVRALAHDLALTFKATFAQMTPLDPASSTKLLMQYLTAPGAVDAQILSGIRFEDAEVAGTDRLLLPEKNDLFNPTKLSKAIWREGADSLSASRASRQAPLRSGIKSLATAVTTPREPTQKLTTQESLGALSDLAIRAERQLITRLLDEKKARKYRTDRDRFFADAASPLARRYHKWSRLFSQPRVGLK